MDREIDALADYYLRETGASAAKKTKDAEIDALADYYLREAGSVKKADKGNVFGSIAQDIAESATTVVPRALMRGITRLGAVPGQILQSLGVAMQGPSVEQQLFGRSSTPSLEKARTSVGAALEQFGAERAKPYEEAAKELFPPTQAEQRGLAEKPIQSLAGVVFESLPMTAAAALATVATANPAAGAAIMGTAIGAGTVSEARQHGAKPDTAMVTGTLNALGQTALEMIPMSELLKPRAMFRVGVAEAGTETVQQLWENLLARHSYDKARDIMQGVLESALAGFFTGEMVGGVLSPKAVTAVNELRKAGVPDEVAAKAGDELARAVAERVAAEDPRIVKAVQEQKTAPATQQEQAAPAVPEQTPAQQTTTTPEAQPVQQPEQPAPVKQEQPVKKTVPIQEAATIQQPSQTPTVAAAEQTITPAEQTTTTETPTVPEERTAETQRETAERNVRDEMFDRAVEMVRKYWGVAKRAAAGEAIDEHTVAAYVIDQYERRKAKKKTFDEWVLSGTDHIVRRAAREAAGITREEVEEAKGETTKGLRSPMDIESDAVLEVVQDTSGRYADVLLEANRLATSGMPIEQQIEKMRQYLNEHENKALHGRKDADIVRLLQEGENVDVGALLERYLNAGVNLEQAYQALSPGVKSFVKQWFWRTGGVDPRVHRMRMAALGLASEYVGRAGRDARMLRRMVENDVKAEYQDDREAADAYRDAINRTIYRALSGEIALDVLPDAYREIVARMRREIDTLSTLAQKHANLTDEQKETFERNMGRYVREAYEYYESPKTWQPTPEQRKALKDELVAQILAAQKDGVIPKTEMQADDIAEGVIRNYETGGRKRDVIWCGRERINLNNLKRRLKLSPAWQEFLGKVEDPAYVYVRTMTDLVSLGIMSTMYEQIAAIPGAVSPYDDGKSPSKIHTKQMPDTPEYGKLAGKWVTPEMYTYLVGTLKLTRDPIAGAIVRGVNMWKEFQTVHNIPTHPRNIMGNIMFNLFAECNILNPKDWKYFKRALEILTNPDKHADIVDELTRARVLGNQYVTGELQGEKKIAFRRANNAVLEMFRTGRDFLRDLYSGEDQFWRVAEALKMREKHPDMSLTDIGEHINNLYPDYSNVPKAVEVLRKTPLSLLGPFVTFKAETARILAGHLRRAKNETKLAKKALMVSKVLFAVFVPQIIRSTAAMVFNIDDEEADGVERLLPSYRRGGSVVLYRDNEGKLRGWDTSYIWPAATFTNLVSAIVRNDLEGVADNLSLFSGPLYTTVSIIVNGYDPYVKKSIDNAADTPHDTILRRGMHAVRQALPPYYPLPPYGVAVQRIIDAYYGTERFGVVRTLPDEILATFTGIRTFYIDPEGLLEREMLKVKTAIRDAERAYHRAIRAGTNEDAARKEYERRVENIQRRIDELEKLEDVFSRH